MKNLFVLLLFSTCAFAVDCVANGTASNPSGASCGAARAGSISCSPSASRGTCRVYTTAVTAESVIFVTQATNLDTRLVKLLLVTCNSEVVPGVVVVQVRDRESFTFTLPSFATNPLCFNYFVKELPKK